MFQLNNSNHYKLSSELEIIVKTLSYCILNADGIEKDTTKIDYGAKFMQKVDSHSIVLIESENSLNLEKVKLLKFKEEAAIHN